MKFKKYPLLFLLCITTCTVLEAQQNLIYNHYYINPFLYNPSFIAPSGYTELHLNYRKQWSGFEGAPQTATMNLQIPLNYKAGLAVTGYQDQAGLIKTTTGLVSFSYQVFLGKRVAELHKIGFGISAGYTATRIDSDQLDDITDPVFGNNTSSMDGQFGMHYQYNRFKLAFAIPRLFESYVASENSFNARGITQIENTISAISYDFFLSPSVSFEPIVTYRTYQTLDDQIEALASLKFTDIGWIGGAYRQDYGAVGFLGVNVKDKLKVGYAYEFATEQADRIGQGTHEVQIVLRLGKKQFTRPQLLSKNETTTTTPKLPAAEPEHVDNGLVPEEQETEPQDQVVSTIPSRNEPTETAPVTRPDTDATRDQVQTQEQPVVRETVAEQKPEPVEEAPTVKRLNGQSLAPGHYVVVGAFRNLQNALNYTATLKRAGYPANVAFHEEREYYIVHMLNATTVEEARIQRDKYRLMSRYSFRDTWILSIE